LRKARRLIILYSFALFFTGFGLVWGEETKTHLTGVVSATSVNVRCEPTLVSAIIGNLAKNMTITIIDENASWYKIRFKNNTEGWIWRQYVSTDLNQINSRGLVRFNLVNFAKNFVNTPYVYGGSSPRGFDCSGFTRYIFSKFGYLLPHRAFEQAKIGESVPKEELQPGDLVFFFTQRSKQVNHAGIYLEAGQFIHASSGSGTVRISSLNEGYYQKRYQGARRIFTTLSAD
jgi:cell wall-associated NlpC family hydrolase